VAKAEAFRLKCDGCPAPGGVSSFLVCTSYSFHSSRNLVRTSLRAIYLKNVGSIRCRLPFLDNLEES
jgi:hypothetical protein